MVFRKSPFSREISKSTKWIAVKFYRTSVYHYEASIHKIRQLVDFETSREKGNFLKNTIGHLGLKGGSINFILFGWKLRVILIGWQLQQWQTNKGHFTSLHHKIHSDPVQDWPRALGNNPPLTARIPRASDADILTKALLPCSSH